MDVRKCLLSVGTFAHPTVQRNEIKNVQGEQQ
jgi:hypothetical protein